jgi:membrane fusion protein (multidrug efflux system)
MAMGKKEILWGCAGVLILLAIAYPKIQKGLHPADSAGSPGGGGAHAKGEKADKGGKGDRGAKGGGGPKVQVAAHVMKPEKIEEKITSTGTVLAGEDVQLKSEASGRIVRLPLKEGARVAKGTLLVKINDADLQAQLIKAKAAYKLAEDKANRQKSLQAKEAISQEDYEVAVQELESARGDLQLLQAQIDKTEIRAPFDGVVGLKYVSEGGYLSQGTAIANYISDRPLKLEFSVPEQYFSAIAAGREVTFSIQGSSRGYRAKVYGVEPKVDESTRTIKVRALCDNADGTIAPGSFAKVDILLQAKPAALMAPSQALISDAKGDKLFVLRGGVPAFQPVSTGLRREEDVEITQGLNPGDTIITSGVMLLKPGAGVDIKSMD